MQQQVRDVLKQKYETIFCEPIQGTGKKCCPCFEECAKSIEECSENRGIDKQHSIICNRNMKVGEYYGVNVPKIVFIGKENTNPSPVDRIDEPACFKEQKNQHYRRTKFMLTALLGLCDNREIDNYNGYTPILISDDTEAILHKQFALTNHYHCAFKKNSKKHGIKSTDTMWCNCAAIVRCELEVLEPDVIVIQAGWSAKEKAAEEKRIEGIQAYFNENKWEITEDHDAFGLYWATNTESGKECCIIGSYHPSFHQWSQEMYLQPLKKRIHVAKQWLEERS